MTGFEDALDELIAEHVPETPLDDIISTLELKLYALREQELAEEAEGE